MIDDGRPWHEIPISIRKMMLSAFAEGRLVRKMICPYCGEYVLHAFFAIFANKRLQLESAQWECLLCQEYHEGPIPADELRDSVMVDASTGLEVEVEWPEKRVQGPPPEMREGANDKG